MKLKQSQWMMLVGVALLAGIFLMPIWQITLSAPQYPEPIGMNIWINKIVDMNPYDLKNINLMNHYVGMADIPERIPEMDYYSKVIYGMIGFGLFFAFFGKSFLHLTWLLLMVIIGMFGVYDFWYWEYTYGHNLDPHAAIKFLDEAGNLLTYQPPLIGEATILNFVATSWPHVGAYVLMASMTLVTLSYLKARKGH